MMRIFVLLARWIGILTAVKRTGA